MFLTNSIKVKVGLAAGMVVGGLLALTAKQMMENGMCMSKSQKLATPRRLTSDTVVQVQKNEGRRQ